MLEVQTFYVEIAFVTALTGYSRQFTDAMAEYMGKCTHDNRDLSILALEISVYYPLYE